MRRVPGDEYAAAAIAVGKAESQLPEPDIVERHIDRRADGLFKEGVEVEIVTCRAGRHWCMEKPVAVQIDSAEELPVAAQVRIDGIEDRLVTIDRQFFIELVRPEDKQRHEPVMGIDCLGNAGGFAHR